MVCGVYGISVVTVVEADGDAVDGEEEDEPVVREA